jgi:hypothetical protein
MIPFFTKSEMTLSRLIEGNGTAINLLVIQDPKMMLTVA